MLADINLLPERKRKNYASLVMMAILALAAFLLMLFMQNQYSTGEAKVNQLKREDQALQEQLAVSAEAAAADSGGSAFQTLANAVAWTEEYPVDFVPIMDELKQKLPNSGYFQALGYTEANKLALSIHLEESREAAFYLNRLKEVPYFKSVKLNELESVEIENPDAANGEEAIAEMETQQPFLATYELELDRVKWKEVQKKGDKQDDSVQ